MRFHILSSILLTSTLLAACGDNIQVYPDTTEAQSIVIDDACPGDPAQISSARLEGNSLVVTARYGGCAQTRIWACWDGTLGSGDPASANVVVHALPAGDCDAAHEATATISLEPMLDQRPLMLHAGTFDLLWRP
jgi:hypothetical protein